MNERAPEIPKSVPELASRALNHEAKLMVFVALEGQTTALTASGLNKEMNAPQNEFTTWVPNAMAAYQYCRLSLVPAGTVHEEMVVARNVDTRAYRLTKYGQGLAIPAAGFLLDWSLRYPQISIQDLLGATNSSGEIRAGETRSRVLKKALSSPVSSSLSVRATFDDGIDPDWESDGYNQEMKRIQKAVKALGLAGILSAESVEFDDDRELLIVDSRMPENVEGRSDHEVALALYEVIFHLDAERLDKDAPLTIRYNDAVVLTLKRLSEKGLEVDPAKVRRAIHNAYFGQASYKGITKADPARFNDGKLTRFNINEDHRDAVEEFLCILDLLGEDDARTHKEGLALLKSVKQNPSQRAQIMSKAFTFSPHAQKKGVLTTAKEVEVLVRELGQGTLDELTNAYVEAIGRPIKRESLRNVLVLLTAKGRIAVESTANADKPGYRLKRHIYTIAQ